MTGLSEAVEQILAAQQKTKKPLAIVLAGHNGSGKSTMWRKRLSGQLQIPLINVEPKGCPQSLGIGGLMYNIFYFDHLGETCKVLSVPVPKETAMKTADEFDENVYPVRRRGPYPVSKSWIGADV